MTASLFMRSAFDPLVIERAEGAYLYTSDSRKILDAGSGAVVVNVGQGRKELAEIAREQISRLNYVLPVWDSAERQRLVERLANWMPGTRRFFFTSGGSEAVEAAIKFAFLYHKVKGMPGRKRIISRRLSYHGNTFGALSASSSPRRADYEHLLFDWPKIPPSYCYRCPWNQSYPGCGLECAQALEDEILRCGADSIAAFIAEPMMGASGGAVPPVAEYWPRIAEICRRHEVLLIADEVMTGFGRTGRRLAVEHWGIKPDIIVGGKGLTGGYVPMGMIAVDERLALECERAGADFMFFTYTGHPLACAIADGVLGIIEREGLVERAAQIGVALGDALRQGLSDHPMVGDIRGGGLFWGIELVADKASRAPFPRETRLIQKLLNAALGRGLFFYPASGMAGASGGDAIMITPPFVIGPPEIAFIVNTLRDSLDEIQSSLPA